MALGAAAASGADIALSVTGVAGPTGGDEVRPVGTVYLGAARDGVAYVKKLFVSRPDRALVRARAAQAALELGLRLAQGKIPEGTQALTAARQSDDAALAALTIANKAYTLMRGVVVGIGQGFQPVSSFNYGAKKYSRVRKASWFTQKGGILCEPGLQQNELGEQVSGAGTYCAEIIEKQGDFFYNVSWM